MLLTHAVLTFALSLASPPLAAADVAPPPAVAPRASPRFVPTLRDGRLVGLKAFAIRKGTRFDRGGLRNGDLIEAIDRAPITGPTSATRLLDPPKALLLHVRREDRQLTLTIPIR